MIYDLQKASMWKRISAFLFDGILVSILAVFFAWGISAALQVDRYQAAVQGAYEKYGAQYGINMQMDFEEYESLTEEGLLALENAYAAMNGDGEAVRAQQMMVYTSLITVSLGILFAFLLWEFLLPLRLGNGQTLGKKIFGLGLMRQDGVKIRPLALFVRTVLGKYTIETMIPVLLILMILMNSIGVVGPIVIFLILLLEGLLLLFTRNHTTLHDLMACTVEIDMASQMIFDTPEDLLAYKQKIQAEKAAREAY